MEKTCYFCGSPCDDDQYCHGCGAYVCEKCEVVNSVAAAFAEHETDDHQIEVENDEEDWA